jgi:Holliday junction resolvase
MYNKINKNINIIKENNKIIIEMKKKKKEIIKINSEYVMCLKTF